MLHSMKAQVRNFSHDYEIMMHITQSHEKFTSYELQLVNLDTKVWVAKVVVGTYTYKAKLI